MSPSALSGTFRTKDGWLQAIVVKDAEFQRFCKAVGWQDLADDPRMASNAKRREHGEMLNARAAELFAGEATAHWQAVLTEARIQHEKLQSYREYVDHPQTQAVEAVARLPQAGSDAEWPVPNVPGLPRMAPGQANAASPTLGQHTRQVLSDLGYGEEAIEKLAADGVIG